MPAKIGNSKLHDEMKGLWSEISQQIECRFDLKAKVCPSVIKVVEDDNQSSNPGWCDGNTLYLTRMAIDCNLPLKAVLARIHLQMILPSEGICNECIDDYSTEFARQVLEGQQRKAWVRWWRSQAPQRKLGTVLDYNPSVSFPLLYDLVGEKGLNRLVREIVAFPKYGVTLDYEEFLIFIRTRFRRFSVSFSSTDLRIVRALLKNNECSYTKIADQLGISAEWLSRRISDLRSKFVLRRFERVPFSKIGIRLFHLLLSTHGSNKDAFMYLASCPFLYSYGRVLTSGWNGLATLSVPNNKNSVKSVQTFLHLLEERKFAALFVEVASSGTAYCFDFYDVKEGCWAIPWDFLAIHLRKIYDDELASAFPRIDVPACKTTLHLDSLDIRILDQVRMGKTSVSKVRATLGIGQERAASRLKMMRESGLIQTTWEVHNIGLNESVIVMSSDGKSGEAIAAWAQRLPRCIISFDEQRKLALIAQLPTGGSYGMASVFSSFSENLITEVLGTKIYGGWGFPADLWNSHNQCWEYPADKVEKWFESFG